MASGPLIGKHHDQPSDSFHVFKLRFSVHLQRHVSILYTDEKSLKYQ
jgi:hypothetical protein